MGVGVGCGVEVAVGDGVAVKVGMGVPVGHGRELTQVRAMVGTCVDMAPWDWAMVVVGVT